MTIVDLKSKIENKNLNDSLLIFNCEEDSFIAKQYIDAISKFKNLDKIFVNDLSHINSSNDLDLFEEDSIKKYMYILNIDKLDELTVSPNKLDLHIIKANNISSDLKQKLKDYIIDFPKLINWQIEDYIKVRLPGLTTDKISWLCDICKYDINRIDNEVQKLEIFSNGYQDLIFREINDDNGYNDLNPLTIFNFTNAIIKRDIETVHTILRDIENIDIEGTGAVTLLTRNFKNIINIQSNPRISPESLGLNAKQFNAIKYNCGKYSLDELIRIYELLTSIDMKLKNGDLPNLLIRDYIIIKILGGQAYEK